MTTSDDHDHVHLGEHVDDPRALRAEALESILIERGIVDPARVDRILDYYETSLGPQHGARVVATAWVDDAFRQRLLADGTAAVRSLGIDGPEIDHLVAVENTDTVHNVVVCTLCSCYPWAVLGLPPRGTSRSSTEPASCANPATSSRRWAASSTTTSRFVSGTRRPRPATSSCPNVPVRPPGSTSISWPRWSGATT